MSDSGDEAAVRTFLGAADEAMASEGIKGKQRERVINRLLYGSPEGVHGGGLIEDLAYIEANGIRVDVFTNSSPMATVRLIHEATGSYVTRSGTDGQIVLRHQAVEEMRRILDQVSA